MGKSGHQKQTSLILISQHFSFGNFITRNCPLKTCCTCIMLWDTGWPQTTFKSWKPWPPPETSTKFTEALQQNKLLLQSNYQVLQYWTHIYIEKYVNSASVLQWSISVCIALHCICNSSCGSFACTLWEPVFTTQLSWRKLCCIYKYKCKCKYR